MAFVDTEVRPAGEVQQKVGRIKLSEAIMRGCELSRPTKEIAADFKAWLAWREEKCFACLIGAAWIGFEGTRRETYWASGPMMDAIAQRSGVSPSILSEAAWRYERGGESRESIATWLESQGL